jgi:hypothetical protein
MSFKIFTKVLTNRINLVAQKAVSPSQAAFLPDIYILEDVIILYETIHGIHERKEKWSHSKT